MGRSAGRLEVEIVARLEGLERGLAAAEARVQKTGKVIDKTLATPGARFGLGMAKAVAAIKAVETGVKAVGVGMSVFAALSAEAAGNSKEAAKQWENVSNTVKQLPLGLGAIASSIEAIFAQVSGLNDLTERQREAHAEILELDKRIAASRSAAEGNKALKAQLSILKETDELTRQRFENFERQRRMMAEMAERMKAAQHSSEFIRDALSQEFQLRKQILDTINRQERAAIKQKRLDEEAAAARDKAAVARDKELKSLRDANAIDEERLGKISRRLGMVTKEAQQQARQGFTTTAQTAIGSFTFAEQDVDKKIKELQEKQWFTQKAIQDRTAQIAAHTASIARNIGFR